MYFTYISDEYKKQSNAPHHSAEVSKTTPNKSYFKLKTNQKYEKIDLSRR